MRNIAFAFFFFFQSKRVWFSHLAITIDITRYYAHAIDTEIRITLERVLREMLDCRELQPLFLSSGLILSASVITRSIIHFIEDYCEIYCETYFGTGQIAVYRRDPETTVSTVRIWQLISTIKNSIERKILIMLILIRALRVLLIKRLRRVRSKTLLYLVDYW